MKQSLSFKLLASKIVLLLGRVIVPIITAGIAVGLIAVLLPAPMAASFQSGASPSPLHRASGSLGLTQTTNLTTTQTLPLDPTAQNLDLVGHFSTTVRAFYVQQDYAYLAAGEEGLQIIDVSDPTAPTLAGTYEISSALVSVAVSGTVAVALDDAGKMLLFDVSTPAAPVELGRYTLLGSGYQVVLAGNYAYIPIGDSGLHIINISTPDAPTAVGVYQTEGAAHVVVAGDYAYLSTNTGLLHIIDITNPNAPTAIRSYGPLWGFGTRAQVVENDRLYLTIQVGTDWTYVKIFDLSDPTAPIPIESELSLDVLKVGAYGLNLAVKDDKIYIPTGRLRMIDVSDPSRPIETGSYKQGGDMIIAANDHVYLADSENGLYIFKPHPVDIPQPRLNVDLVGHFGGAANTVLVQDDYAYVGFGPEMAILDVSNPTAPRRIGYLVLPGQDENEVNAITVVGTYAYVADNYGLWVVDVSEPTTPFVVGYTSCQCGVNTDVSVVGQYAYLTIYLSGGGSSGGSKFGRGYFKVVDVSDPAHPFEVSTFETSDGGGMFMGARAVQVIDNYAYVADSEIYGLRLFDISDPADPIEVGNSRGGVEDFVLRDGYAYVTNGREGGLRVIDVSDPTTLNSLGFYESLDETSERGRSGDVALLDDYAYYVDDPLVVSSEPRGDYGLRIVNISNPINPTAAGFYTTTAHITDLTIRDHYAYFTMPGSLHILDLSDPTHPVEIGAYQTPPSASKISVDDNHAYVVTGRWWEDKELQVVDISNPAQPVTIERAATDLGPTTPVVDGYAYLIDEGDLRILDVSNPATLTQVGVYTTVAPIDEIVTRGDFAYLLSGYRLAVLDVSDPTAPTQVYSYTLPPSDQYDPPAPDLALIDDYLYLISASTGLRIFDISEPSQLVEVKTDQEIAGEHLVVDNDYAYVATKGLQILDISDPASPTIVGATEVGLFGVRWSIRGIAVDDNYAYLINDVVGLRIIDISNPTAPVEVGFSPILGTPADLAVTDDHIWVATEASGLFRFQLTPVDEISPSPNILQPLPPATPAALLTPTVSATPTPTSTPIPIQKSKNIDLVGSFEDSVERILVQGDYAYAALGLTFKVLDISDRTRPQEIGRVELPGDIGSMTIVNDYAYVTCSESGLSIVTLADLSNPTEVGHYELESYSIYTTIAGDYAYLGDDSSLGGGNSGLHIVDISDPVSPSRVGFYPELFAKYTTITDDYAYLSGSSGLHIIDVSDPISPSRVGLYSHPYGNSPGKATVAGNYAYFTDLGGLQITGGPLDGLQTIDISNPAHPVRVKANLRQHRIEDVTPDYLYVTGSDGLQRLDISNPFAPAVDIAITTSFIYIYMIEGDHAFLRGESNSLRVVDLSDPTAPTELGFYYKPEGVYMLAVVDDYIYVKEGGEDRLLILQFTGSTSDPTVN
jgi:hypothetical protein